MKKNLLLTIPAALLIVGGTVLAWPDGQKPASNPKNVASVQPANNTLTPNTDTPQPVGTKQTENQPEVAPISTPVPTPQPAYGEDPNNPGTFVVFDTAAVMTEAGISPEDMQYVEGAVDRCSLYKDGKWVYNIGGMNSHRTLLNLSNDTIAAAKQQYPDFSTNPVSQIKWATNYAITKYGSWKAAYNTCYLKGRF